PAPSQYFLRFVLDDGTLLSIDGNTLFAVTPFSTGSSQPIDFMSSATALPSFTPLSLTFGDSGLEPVLLQDLASHTTFREIDVLGYTSNGQLATAFQAGNVAAGSLAAGQGPGGTLSLAYGSVSTTANIFNSSGKQVGQTTSAWDTATDSPIFN